MYSVRKKGSILIPNTLKDYSRDMSNGTLLPVTNELMSSDGGTHKLQVFWSSSGPNTTLLEHSRAFNIVILVYLFSFGLMLSTTQEVYY